MLQGAAPGPVRTFGRVEIGRDVRSLHLTERHVEVETGEAVYALRLDGLERDFEKRVTAARLPQSVAQVVDGRVVAHAALPPRYLVISEHGAGRLRLQVVTMRAPLVVRDVNGDGVVTLACLGDSNTAVQRSDVKRW